MDIEECDSPLAPIRFLPAVAPCGTVFNSLSAPVSVDVSGSCCGECADVTLAPCEFPLEDIKMISGLIEDSYTHFSDKQLEERGVLGEQYTIDVEGSRFRVRRGDSLVFDIHGCQTLDPRENNFSPNATGTTHVSFCMYDTPLAGWADAFLPEARSFFVDGFSGLRQNFNSVGKGFLDGLEFVFLYVLGVPGIRTAFESVVDAVIPENHTVVFDSAAFLTLPGLGPMVILMVLRTFVFWPVSSLLRAVHSAEINRYLKTYRAGKLIILDFRIQRLNLFLEVFAFACLWGGLYFLHDADPYLTACFLLGGCFLVFFVSLASQYCLKKTFSVASYDLQIELANKASANPIFANPLWFRVLYHVFHIVGFLPLSLALFPAEVDNMVVSFLRIVLTISEWVLPL